MACARAVLRASTRCWSRTVPLPQARRALHACATCSAIFGWIGITYAGSAVGGRAAVPDLSQQSGIGVLMAAAPIIAMLLATLHYFFRQQEADEVVRRRAARRRRARGRARGAPCARARGQRAALPQRLHACLDRHGAGRRSTAASCRPTRRCARCWASADERRWCSAHVQRLRRRRRRAPALNDQLQPAATRSESRRPSPSSCGCATATAAEVWAAVHGSLFSEPTPTHPA